MFVTEFRRVLFRSATQQTAAPAVQEQKPQKSQKSAIDNILKKEAKKKEEPAKEEKQAESKTEAIKPEKKEPAIVPVVKASSVQEQTTEKPTHQPVKAPQKEEVTVTDSKKADVREVPDLVDSHNVFKVALPYMGIYKEYTPDKKEP